MKSVIFALIAIISCLIMSTESASVEFVKRASYTGRATFYDVGMGSCGKKNSDSELVVALSGKLMGKSKSTKYCGKYITIKGPKGMFKCKVVDTCPGCASGDIDLSPAAFKKLGPLSKGVIKISWSI